jgi:hypothetical protein
MGFCSRTVTGSQCKLTSWLTSIWWCRCCPYENVMHEYTHERGMPMFAQVLFELSIRATAVEFNNRYGSVFFFFFNFNTADAHTSLKPNARYAAITDQLPDFIDKLTSSTRNEFVFICCLDLATISSTWNQERWKEDAVRIQIKSRKGSWPTPANGTPLASTENLNRNLHTKTRGIIWCHQRKKERSRQS